MRTIVITVITVLIMSVAFLMLSRYMAWSLRRHRDRHPIEISRSRAYENMGKIAQEDNWDIIKMSDISLPVLEHRPMTKAEHALLVKEFIKPMSKFMTSADEFDWLNESTRLGTRFLDEIIGDGYVALPFYGGM